MDNFNTAWWLALLAAIPIGILSNLGTSWVQSYVRSRPQRRKRQKINDLKSDLRRIEYIQDNYETKSDYLLFALLKLARIGAILGVVSMLGYAMTPFVAITMIGSMLTLSASLILFTLASRAMHDYRLVDQQAEIAASLAMLQMAQDSKTPQDFSESIHTD